MWHYVKRESLDEDVFCCWKPEAKEEEADEEEEEEDKDNEELGT